MLRGVWQGSRGVGTEELEVAISEIGRIEKEEGTRKHDEVQKAPSRDPGGPRRAEPRTRRFRREGRGVGDVATVRLGETGLDALGRLPAPQRDEIKAGVGLGRFDRGVDRNADFQLAIFELINAPNALAVEGPEHVISWA